MNFQQLRHFVVTAQAGNIVKAAETLYISQSGLSRSIGALEHLIGLPLFERSPKGVTLTEYGRYFLPGAQLMLNEHRRYVEELKAFRELRAGSLALGINHSFAYLIVPQAVTSLLKRWPSVNISIVTDNYQALVEQLVTGDLDLALSLYTEASMREDLHYEPLDELRTVTLAREGHPLLDGRAVTMADLAQADWALIKGASVEAAFGGVFESHGLALPNVSLRCASVALLASVVAGTDLLAVLPEELLGGQSVSKLRRLPIEGAFGVARVGLIRRRESAQLPIGEKLATAIRAEIAALRKSHSDTPAHH